MTNENKSTLVEGIVEEFDDRAQYYIIPKEIIEDVKSFLRTHIAAIEERVMGVVPPEDEYVYDEDKEECQNREEVCEIYATCGEAEAGGFNSCRYRLRTALSEIFNPKQ